jgi:hypothetical protein
MKKLILFLLVVMVSFAFLNADVYIKQQTKTMVQGKETLAYTETWMAKNKTATKTDKSISILNLDLKKMYIITPATKTYIELDLPLDMTKLIPAQQMQMMKPMLDKMTVSVTPNGQKKKILNCDCNGYILTMNMGMEMKMTFWASTNVPFDWKSYYSMYQDMMKSSFAMYGEKYFKEFLKIQGYPLGMDMNMMGTSVSMTTVEIKPNVTAPAGAFSVPAGYTKKTAF